MFYLQISHELLAKLKLSTLNFTSFDLYNDILHVHKFYGLEIDRKIPSRHVILFT
ncbi:hypothetical protein KSS87_005621, partial [Heliosperma pusillum]